MDSMKYPIKGIVLDEKDIVKIHEYYKNYSMAEYLNAVYGLEETDAFKAAAGVLDLIENHEHSETEAINKILSSEGFIILNPQNDTTNKETN